MLLSRLKSGFSLIEMVLVISIIAILAVVIASSFGRTLERYRLGLLVDDFISVVNQERRTVAQTGERTCRGFILSEQGLATIQAPYQNALLGCDDFNKENLSFLTDDFVVRSAQVGKTDRKEFTFYFAPPRGAIFWPTEPEFWEAQSILELELAVSQTSELTRRVYLQLDTGRVLSSDPRIDE